MSIAIDPAFRPDSARRTATLAGKLGFGVHYTDRMFTVQWTTDEGWHDPRIGKLEPIALDPAAAVLHYGQAVFEGLKAYRRADGEILLFRPEMNARRYAASSERLVMPALPEPEFVEAIETLVDLERQWVPSGEMQSLYVRPFCVATEAALAVRPAQRYCFAIILSPVGAYYESGFSPVKILVSDELVRAAKGGTGAAKAAGNYAASLLAGKRAGEAGCAQVLWLDAAERRFVEEIGAMNVMFVIDGELVTPPLSGSILPGVTRDSVLALAREQGVKVHERPLELAEVLARIADGRCSEAFGCGTAAVITAIGSFVHQGREHALASAPGPFSTAMFRTLTDLQWGRSADTRGWVRVVPRRAT